MESFSPSSVITNIFVTEFNSVKKHLGKLNWVESGAISNPKKLCSGESEISQKYQTGNFGIYCQLCISINLEVLLLFSPCYVSQYRLTNQWI